MIGIDSLDTHSWIRAAAHGKILLSGKGQRFVVKNEKRFKYKQWSKEINLETYNCRCPCCKTFGIDGLAQSQELRALHNIWVIKSEVELARKRIRKGDYLDFIKQRIKDTYLEKLFFYIKNKNIQTKLI